ncbi:MAG: type II secretion system protein GspJ [Candidatus Omnitrophica bacterium]|nr:type II secretion system protein GspJ [Candidatus Omnitrophota bacterium]
MPLPVIYPMPCVCSMHAAARIRQQQKGFTLVELLVVVSIVSLIGVGLYSAFHTGLLSYRKIDATSQIYQNGRITFQRLQRDLANALIWHPEDSKFIGQATALDFFGVTDDYHEGNLTHTICHTRYELTGGVLERTCFMGLEALTQSSTPVAQKFCDNVKEISFQYAAKAVDTDISYQWQNAWPRENSEGQMKTLPLAVKVKLVIAHQGEQGREETAEFNTIIPLPLGGQ